METVAERLKAKLAKLTPEQIIPRAFAITLPKELKGKLVDNDIYLKCGVKQKGRNKNNPSCVVQ